MRAMPLAFPNDPLAWGFEEQYLLGPALLVAPVLKPGGKVCMYLPPGIWYDVWSGERLEGPRFLEQIIPLDHIPVYGREGYILPLGPAVQHTGELESELQIDELWAFGQPQQGLLLPDLPPDLATAHNYQPSQINKYPMSKRR
jgi:alpha-D-xyloside xylohydrolase